MSKKFSYIEVKEYVASLECILISTEYLNNEQRLILKDNDGYYYSHSLNELKKKGINFNSKVHVKNIYSLQNIKLWLNKHYNNFQLLSDKYIGTNSPLILKDDENFYYFISWNCLLQGNTPRKFYVSNPYIIHNINLWCKLNNKPFRLISEEYQGCHKNLKWQCLKDECGDIFEMTWATVSQGHGCACCDGRQVGLSNCLATKNPELAKEWHPTKNGDLTPFNVTLGSSKKVWWKCSKCGHEWKCSINDKIRHGNILSCSACSESKGEKRIREWLRLNNILFESQKEFNGLVGLSNGLLSYDFYLSNYNLLIEYQGEFHDGNGNYFVKKNLKKQLQHDKRKKEYAHKHNINLLEIWYWDYDNIEEILESELYSKKVVTI